MRGAYGCWCRRFWEENGIHLVWGPDDEEILKEGTVDFLNSFAYYQRVIASNGEDLDS